MLDILDFGEFLRRRALIRNASDAEIRAIAEENRFSAWRFNVSETLLAGAPAAALTFLINGVFFTRPRLDAYDFQDQVHIIAATNASIASAWVLPVLTFGLAFFATFVFVVGLIRGAAGRELARKIYLLVEGARGLGPQAMLLAGGALLLPAIQLVEALGVDYENLADLEWRRVEILLAAMLGLGAVLALVGGVGSFYVNAIQVPGLVARVCGVAPSGVAFRVVAHAIVSMIAAYILGALLAALVAAFGYGSAYLFLWVRGWIFAG